MDLFYFFPGYGTLAHKNTHLIYKPQTFMSTNLCNFRLDVSLLKLICIWDSITRYLHVIPLKQPKYLLAFLRGQATGNYTTRLAIRLPSSSSEG